MYTCTEGRTSSGLFPAEKKKSFSFLSPFTILILFFHSFSRLFIHPLYQIWRKLQKRKESPSKKFGYYYYYYLFCLDQESSRNWGNWWNSIFDFSFFFQLRSRSIRKWVVFHASIQTRKKSWIPKIGEMVQRKARQWLNLIYLGYLQVSSGFRDPIFAFMFYIFFQ